MIGYNDRKYLLGQKTKQGRLAAGLSRRKFALMLGTAQSYVWRLEKGQINPTLEAICRIADALGLQVRDMFDF